MTKASAWIRIAAYIAVGGVLLVGCTLSLPWILSTEKGTKWLCEQVGKRVNYTLEMRTLSLHWLGPQILTEVEAKSEAEGIHLLVPQVTLEAPLWQILFGLGIGPVNLDAPSLTLSKSLQGAVKVSSPPLEAAGLLPQFRLGTALPSSSWRGTLAIHEGMMRFESPGLDPIEFNQIDLFMEVNSLNEMRGSLQCVTKGVGGEGKVAISGSLSGEHSSFEASIQSLPTYGIDKLASLFLPQYSDLLLELVGPSLNAECSLKSEADEASIHLNLLSSQLKADVRATSANGLFSLEEPATLSFHITPLFAKHALHELSLETPAEVQVTVSKLHTPFPFKEETLSLSAFEASLSSSKLSGVFAGTPLKLDSLALNVQTPSLQDEFSYEVLCQLKGQEGAGSLRARGHLLRPLQEEREGSLSMETEQFPLLGALSSLGSSVNMKLEAALGGEAPQTKLSWNSEFLQLPSLVFSLKGPWTLLFPAPFTYQVFSAGPLFSHVGSIQGILEKGTFFPEDVRRVQAELTLSTDEVLLASLPHFPLSHVRAALLIDTMEKISLQVQSDTLSASASGALDLSRGVLVLTQPLTLSSTPDLPLLKKGTTLQFSLDPSTFTLSDPLSTPLKGQLFCAEAELNSVGQPLTVQNLSLPFHWDHKSQRLDCQLSAQMKTGGALRAKLACFPENKGETLRVANALVEGTLSSQNVASELLDTLMGSTLPSTLIGPSFNSEITLSSRPLEQKLSLKWESALVHCDSSLLLDQEGVHLTSPALFKWNLSGDGYRLLDQMLTGESQPLFSLDSPTTFTLSLSQLSLPVSKMEGRLPSLKLNLEDLFLVAEASASSLSFTDKGSQEHFSLTDLHCAVNKKKGSSNFSSELSSTLSSQAAGTTKSGSLSCRAEGELTPMDFSALKGSFHLQAKQFPTRLLDLFSRASGHPNLSLSTLLGPTLHLSCDTDLDHLSGPLSLLLNTPSAEAELQGHLDKGVLLLDKPLYAHFLATKEGSQVLLDEVNLLDLSSFHSLAPLTLTLSDKAFSLPLFPFIPEKVTLSSGSLELGRVACRNEGNVNIALGLLKAKQFGGEEELNCWFAPLEFSAQEGKLFIDRTELLVADLFDVCLWGQIDLAKEYVDMSLGLTAQTLYRAFGIKNLPENYVLIIPMKGKMDHVQINSGKAAAKIGLLLAAEQKDLAGALGGPAGAFAGELLGALATLPDAKAKVPPPKHPFPWEVGREPSSPPSKKNRFKTTDKPFKQVYKVFK